VLLDPCRESWIRHPRTMNATCSTPKLRRASRHPLPFAALTLLGALAVVAPAWAQSAPTLPAATDEKPAVKPVVTAAKDPEVVELSPFVVNSSADTGYQATSTLAGTRLNTDLKDIGAAVSVYTQEFLQDINVTKLSEVLSYTASTEGAGKNGNYSGIVGENSAEVRDDPSSVNRVRALAQATRTRDFFPTDIPGDTFNFDTLTISRGPNAILAGVGNAGGVMDSAMRKASFQDSTRIVSRFSAYDSHREELHFNKVLIPRRLAVRLALVNDEEKFRQQPAYDTDRRIYGAVQYRAFEPERGGFFGRGTFRGNFETGRIEGVPTDPLTPTFTVANWFNDLNPKWQWWGYGTPLTNSPTTSNAATLSALRNSAGVGIVPAGSGVIQGFPLYTQFALVFADPTSGVPSVGLTDPALAGVQGFQGTIPTSLPGGTGGSLRSTGDANRLRTGYVRTHLSDPNIYNFYDNLMTGALDFRSQTFNATDLRYEQLLLDGKAGVEVAYNYQTFTRNRNFAIPTGGNDEGILVDVNYYLSVKSPTGQPILNPNFGRPFITTTDVFRDQMNRTNRESYQATAFFKHDFTTKNNWQRWLGRHTVSALAFKTNIEKFNRTYASTWDPAATPSPQASLNAAQPGTFGTQVNGWFYIGPSLLNVNSVNDVRLQSISASLPKANQPYTVRVYDPVSRTFVNSTSTPLRILQRLVDQREDLESTAFALQSHWLKNHIVTVVGWREDIDQAYTSLANTRFANGGIDESAVTFQPSSAQGSRTWTKSVVGRLPWELPFNSQLRAHWNESGNFNPVGQRRNVWNEDVGSPTALTEEKGVSLSAFGGKLELRVNKYNTKIENDSISVPNPYNYISTLIGRLLAARDAGLLPKDWGYVYPSWNSFSDVALDVYATIPARLRANIGPDKNFNPRFTGSGSTLQWTPESIINLTSVSNTESYGTEFEAIVNPLPGWRVALSVAKNEAVKSAVAAQELAFAAEWQQNLATMYGGALLPGSRAPTSGLRDTFISQYISETLPGIRTQAALSGTASPEIRRWRANLVTRYEFQRGLLKGLSVGGAVRWQDKAGIGYRYVNVPGTGIIADINQPFFGPEDVKYDANLGYKRRFKVGGMNLNWTIGVSARNLNAKDELIPIAANADGSIGTFRIPPDRTWTVTNSFAF
jgi:hypothetical protein